MRVALLGPTTPLVPGAFAGTRVDLLAGMVPRGDVPGCCGRSATALARRDSAALRKVYCVLAGRRRSRVVTGVRLRAPGGLELTDRLVSAAGLPPGAAVLDVGCGAGATVAHLADESRAARDRPGRLRARRFAQAAEARPDLDFVAGRAEALPFPDALVRRRPLRVRALDAGRRRRSRWPRWRVSSSRRPRWSSDLYVARRGPRRAGGVAALGGSRDDGDEALLAGAGLGSTLWHDEPARSAGTSGTTPARAPGRPVLPPGRGAPRPGARPRLGYFACVARPRPRAEKGACK